MARAIIILALLGFIGTTQVSNAVSNSHDELRASIRASLSNDNATAVLSPAEYEGLVEALVEQSIEKGVTAETLTPEQEMYISTNIDAAPACSIVSDTWCVFFEKIGHFVSAHWLIFLGLTSAFLMLLTLKLKAHHQK